MKMRVRRICWVLYLVLAGLFWGSCAGESPNVNTREPRSDGKGAISLTAPETALRVSMALRGIRPTRAELERIAEDPGELPGLVDTWIKSPQFGDTLRDLHHAIWKLRSDLSFLPTVGKLYQMGAYIWEVNDAIYEAPLRLVEDLIVNDQPYTSILSADYLLANDFVATVWEVKEAPDAGVGVPSDGGGSWRRMRWADGRPSAGILSSSALFLRYPSNGQNFQRERAKVVADALLCHDYLDREVPFDGNLDLSDSDAVAAAVSEDPVCASCHQTLDPLASFFWGFRGFLVVEQITDYPIAWYTSAHEVLWQKTTQRPPGFYGDLGGDLSSLGEKIAADPRFARCTVERFWSWFNQRPRSELDFSTREILIQTFVQSGYSAKALIKGIVLDTDFHRAEAELDVLGEDIRGYLKVRPDQLVRLFDSLLGFKWRAELEDSVPAGTFGEVDLMRSEVLGFRSLFGGIDGTYASSAVHTASINSSLVLQQMARHAAASVVSRVLVKGEYNSLLSMIEKPWADEDEMRSWLVDLHFKLFAERLESDSEAISRSYGLLVELEELSGDPTRAWTGLLTAMLRDPRMLYY